MMHTNNFDERELVDRARKDRAAFGRLFDAHYDAILNYILHRTADVHLAHELASNTFFIALRKLWQFKWRKVPFSAWLYRIASNEVAKHYRQRKATPTRAIDLEREDFIDHHSHADREISEAERKVAESRLFLELHRALQKMSARYQEVVVLKYFENKRISEIAEITGKAEGTIKSLLHRAHKQLREQIEPVFLSEMES